MWERECRGQARCSGADQGTAPCFGFSFLLQVYSEQEQAEEDAELVLLGHVSSSTLTSVKAQHFDQVFAKSNKLALR